MTLVTASAKSMRPGTQVGTLLRSSHPSFTAEVTAHKVEGQLHNGWVPEFDRLCGPVLRKGRHLTPDLSKVSSCSAGAWLLVRIRARPGARRISPSYLDEVLKIIDDIDKGERRGFDAGLC